MLHIWHIVWAVYFLSISQSAEQPEFIYSNVKHVDSLVQHVINTVDSNAGMSVLLAMSC